MELIEIQAQCLEDSETWFPEVAHNLGYMTIALAGEVGEFCNLFKKIERGTTELTEDTHVELAMELTDILIYLCNMAAIMNVDLSKCYELKRAYNEKRFSAGSPNHSDVNVGFDGDDEVPNDPTPFVPVADVFKPLQGRS